MGAAEPQVAEVEATNAVWCILERTSDTNVAAIGKSTVDVQQDLACCKVACCDSMLAHPDSEAANRRVYKILGVVIILNDFLCHVCR
jgi:hypothetical protein